MHAREQEEVVLLDLNVLGWLYSPPAFEGNRPKRFDLDEERQALIDLGHERLSFLYDSWHLGQNHDVTFAEVKKIFPSLHELTWSHTAPKIHRFTDYLKDRGEKQDDIDILARAAFFGNRQKRIKYLLTLDVGFTNRLDTICNKIRRNGELWKWLQQRRPDFGSMKILLPSELLSFLTLDI